MQARKLKIFCKLIFYLFVHCGSSNWMQAWKSNALSKLIFYLFVHYDSTPLILIIYIIHLDILDISQSTT